MIRKTTAWMAGLSVLLFLIGPAHTDPTPDLFARAVELDKNGFYIDSVKAWEQIMNSDSPEDLRTIAQLKLSSTYLKLGRFTKAAETARVLTESQPDNFDAFFHLANALAGVRRFPEAIQAYRKAIELRPQEGLAYVGLALSLFGDGKTPEAAEVLRDASDIFKKKKNIAWHQNIRIMIPQMKNFGRYPPDFSDLWLRNNIKLVRDTYENLVFDMDSLRN